MAVSIRVSEDMKARIARLAEGRELTPHGFMLEAIREKVEAEEARLAFIEQAQRRLTRMKKTGLAIPATEVFDYLRQRAAGGKPARPKARRMA